MKKTFAVLLVLVMMLAFSVTAFAAGSKLTQEQAKQAALDYAGVEASAATFTKVKRDWDDGREVFEIEFYADGTEYDMDVDVLNGRITDFSTEYHGGYGQSGNGSGFRRDYDDDWDDRYDDDWDDWYDDDWDDWYDYGSNGQITGGWTAADDPEITSETEQMLSTALDSYQTGKAAVSYTPVAYLGSQVVAGTNHAILCQASDSSRGSSWVIIYLYEDLHGDVTVMNIARFDFGSLCTYGAGSRIG